MLDLHEAMDIVKKKEPNMNINHVLEYENYYGFVDLMNGNSCIYTVNKETGETKWMHMLESSKMRILKLIKPNQLEES